MDSKTYERISTPTPNQTSDGRRIFTCAETGCSNKITMPDNWEGQETRALFNKQGWIHLLDYNYCSTHALRAVAAELNLRMHRERGLGH